MALRGEPGFGVLLETAEASNQVWMKDAGAIVGVVANTILTDHAACSALAVAAFVERGLASMQAGIFARGIARTHEGAVFACRGRLPKTKQRKDLKDIAFRVGRRSQRGAGPF